MRCRLSYVPALALFLATPAWADDSCKKQLTLVTTLPLTDISGGLFSIPVMLNGVEKHFLFDTGGFFPQISPSVVSELMLKPHELARGEFELYGVDGSVSKKLVTVPSFGLGPIHLTNYDMPVSPNYDGDGVFAPLPYKKFYFEMDFSSRKINIFLGDHCESAGVYWPSKALAIVPIAMRDGDIKIPVTIDGHKFTAIVDTGASTSTMRLDVAKNVFALAPESDDMKIIGHLGGDEKAPVYQHHFKTLSFEGVTVTNPQIKILTDIVNKQECRPRPADGQPYQKSE